jgi:hypothetical protein
METYGGYNIDAIAVYSDNTSYRSTLRQLFFMDVSMCSAMDNESMDEESRDELMYDDASVVKVMGNIYQLTRDNELFQKLYDLAAEKMISTNREIGQAVLFSYDYLPLFHKCLASFLRNPDGFNDSNEFYVALLKKIV